MSTFIITHKKEFNIACKSDHPTFSVILTQAPVLSCSTWHHWFSWQSFYITTQLTMTQAVITYQPLSKEAPCSIPGHTL